MISVRVLVAWATCFVTLLLPWRVRAAELEYSQVDQTVVRVMALGLSDMVQLKHNGTTYRFARPVGGHGSGTIVDKSGLILTAAHVVEDANLVSISLPAADQALIAEVIFEDKEHDFAFLRVQGPLPNASPIPSENMKLKVRSTVYAIGYPLDAKRKDPQSTRGVVSGLLPDSRLQLDISVNPGNSGGPIIDEREHIVGVVVARGDVSQGVTNLAIAVPLEMFRGKYLELKSANKASVPATERRIKLAAMTKRAAEQGGDWFSNSLESKDSEASLTDAREILKQASDLHDSPEALVLAASYLWNWRVVREARGMNGWKVIERKVVTLCRMAVKLESKLESRSTFVAYILGKLDESEDDSKPFELEVSDGGAGKGSDESAAVGSEVVSGKGRYSLVPAASGYSTRTAVGADLAFDGGTPGSLVVPISLLWGALIANSVRLAGTFDIGWGAVVTDKRQKGGSVLLDAGLGGEVDILLGRTVYLGGAASVLDGFGDERYTHLGFRADGVLGIQLDQSADSQFGFLLRGGYRSRGSSGASGPELGLFLSWNRFPMVDAAWR